MKIDLNKPFFIDPSTNLKRYTADDIGLSRLFADIHNKMVMYVPEKEKSCPWYVYDGKRWVDDKNSRIQGLMKEFAINLKDMNPYVEELEQFKAKKSSMHTVGESGEIISIGDPSELKNIDKQINILESSSKKWIKAVMQLQSRAARQTIIKDSVDELSRSNKNIDTDKMLFNCENKTIDLITEKRGRRLREHCPDDYITRIASVKYNPKADSELWDKFIFDIMCGDINLIEFLQKCCGYMLSGDISQKCFFILYGPKTNNGKSTFIGALHTVFGDYATTLNAHSIMERQGAQAGAASPDIAKLQGVRLVTISELPKNGKIDPIRIKEFTGRDGITARALFEQEITFQAQFKLMMGANHLSKITDDSVFSSGRAIIIPFNAEFKPDDKTTDRRIDEKLSTPECKSAILNWMIEGYRMYLADGSTLERPAAVKKLTAQYRDENDIFGQFLKECLIKHDGERTRWEEVKECCNAWYKDCDLRPLTSHAIRHEMERLDMIIEHKGANRKWVVGYVIRGE